MTSPRQLLETIRTYASIRHLDAEGMLKELTEEQLQQAILVSAHLFKQVKGEAVRRGVWDKIRGIKV